MTTGKRTNGATPGYRLTAPVKAHPGTETPGVAPAIKDLNPTCGCDDCASGGFHIFEPKAHSVARPRMRDPRLVEAGVKLLLEGIGEDSEREGLKETPSRFVRAMAELTLGYQDDPAAILSTSFDDGGTPGGLIVVDGVEFTSLCEHHLMPFFGSAVVAYVPSGNRVVGLSKLPRLVQCFARRLQVQERMTSQIADALCAYLNPAGVAVAIRGLHTCMKARGVKSSGEMITREFRGVLETDRVLQRDFNELAQPTLTARARL